MPTSNAFGYPMLTSTSTTLHRYRIGIGWKKSSTTEGPRLISNPFSTMKIQANNEENIVLIYRQLQKILSNKYVKKKKKKIMRITMSKYREGVGTSKIRMSRGQNVESIFWTIRTSKVKRSER
jgi:hypothetical protein